MPLPCKWQPRSWRGGREHWCRRCSKGRAAFCSCGRFRHRVWCFPEGIFHHRLSFQQQKWRTCKYRGLTWLQIVLVEANDVANSTRHRAYNRLGSGHPPFQWEGIEVGRQLRVLLTFCHVHGVCVGVCVDKHGG